MWEQERLRGRAGGITEGVNVGVGVITYSGMKVLMWGWGVRKSVRVDVGVPARWWV